MRQATRWGFVVWLFVSALLGASCDGDDGLQAQGENHRDAGDRDAGEPRGDASRNERDAGTAADAGWTPDGGSTSDASSDATAGDPCAEDNGGCGDPAHRTCSIGVAGTALCTDVDQCTADNGGCEERCVAREGGFSCGCNAGGDLDADGLACRRWAEVEYVGDLTYGGEIALATHPAGHGVLIAHNLSEGVMYATHYRPGKGWDAQIAIDDTHPNDRSQWTVPTIAIDPAGNALLLSNGTYGQNDDRWPHELLFQRYDADEESWSAPIALDAWGEPSLYNNDLWRSLQLNGSGDRFAVWATHGVWASRWSASDEAWSDPVLLDGAVSARAPVLAVDAAGNALVVWQRDNGMWAAHHTAVGGWQDPVQIDAGFAGDPLLGMDDEGHALVAWRPELQAELWVADFDASSGWSEAKRLGWENGDRVFTPKLAVDRKGEGLLSWGQAGRIWTSKFERGVGWQEPVAISTSAVRSGALPQLALDGAGDAYVAWRDHRPEGDLIWANVRRGGEWQGATMLASDAQDELQAPVLAAHAGRAVLGWPTSDGLVASRYSNGAWGEPVALALEMSEIFDQPRAAHLDGGFVIVWRSDQSFRLPGPEGAVVVAMSLYATTER
jgi:hypothetical protein